MGPKVLTQIISNQYHALGITTRLDLSILVIPKRRGIKNKGQGSDPSPNCANRLDLSILVIPKTYIHT